MSLAFGALERDGLIEIDDGHIVVRDFLALMAASDAHGSSIWPSSQKVRC